MSGSRRREPAGARVLDRRDGRRGDVEIALVVERMGNRDADQRGEADPYQPPDMPDEREAHDQADPREDDTRAGVARHVDVAEPRHRPAVAAPLPVVPRSEEHPSELQSLMRISYAV